MSSSSSLTSWLFKSGVRCLRLHQVCKITSKICSSGGHRGHVWKNCIVFTVRLKIFKILATVLSGICLYSIFLLIQQPASPASWSKSKFMWWFWIYPADRSFPFFPWGALFSTLVNTARISIHPAHLDLAQVAANREDWRWHMSCQRRHSHLFPGDACVCTAPVKSNSIFNANWMPVSMRWRSWCDLSKP